MSVTGEHPAAESPETKPAAPPPASLPGVLMALANLIFKREAAMWIAFAVVMLGAGASTVVWAQAKLDGGVAPVRAELAQEVAKREAAEAANADLHRAQQAEAEDLRRRMANVERVSLETNLNVRLLLEERRLTPVTLEPPKDGGQ